MAGLELDDVTIGVMVGALGSAPGPVKADGARFDRQMRDLALGEANVLHAIYDRIVVTGRSIVSARLTPSAYAHRLAIVLPTKVAVARPTGVGRTLATYEIPIEGRDEWLAPAGIASA